MNWSLVGPWISGVISKLGGGISLFLYLVFVPTPTANDDVDLVADSYAVDNQIETAIADVTITQAAKTKYKKRYAVHHIVPQKHIMARPAQKILNEYLRYGVQSPYNKVVLPVEDHSYLHTHAYIGYVNGRIISAERSGFASAEKKGRIIRTLIVLRLELSASSLI